MTYGIVLDFARQMGVNRITKKEKDRLNWPSSTLRYLTITFIIKSQLLYHDP